MAGDLYHPLPAAHTPWPWRFWSAWVGANAVAELLGLGASALLWVLYFLGMEERLGAIGAASLVVIGSTLFEGTAVGLAQWQILRQALPKLSVGAWWGATSVGALIAWTLGMTPSTLFSLSSETAASVNGGASPAEISDALIYTLAAGMGLALGPLLALPQWWVLRRHLPQSQANSWWWIPANAAAWALGMPIIFWMMQFVPTGAVTLRTILLLMGGLALTGATVGAVHGLVLIRLLQRPRPG